MAIKKNSGRGVIFATCLFLSLPVCATGIGDVVDDIQPGTWYEVPDTKMTAVFPSQTGHPAWGTGGPATVVSDWGGAAFDSDRNVFMITGGGHANYGGNEVYEFWLSDFTWRRPTDPAAMENDPAYSGDTYWYNYFRTLDGSPVSSHTYDGIEYIPTTGDLFKYGGSQYKMGNNYDWHAYLYDIAATDWTQYGNARTYSLEVASAWDSTRNRMLVYHKDGLSAFDPATQTWSVITSGEPADYGRVAAYDPVNDRLVLLGIQGDPLVYYDLSDASPSRTTGTMTGDSVGTWHVGFEYDESEQVFLVWTGYGPVFKLDPTTFEVTKFTPPAGSPQPDRKFTDGTDKNSGVYSRWQYVPDYGVFVAYNSAYDNVWIYKPPYASTVPVPPDPTPDTCTADLCVGPGHAYALPSEAIAAATNGQTIEIEAGQYEDCAVIPVSVTITGINGRPVIGNTTCENKGIFVTQGDSITLNNLELVGAWTGGGNAAGIRHEGKILTLNNMSIHDNQNGILTDHDPLIELYVYDSEFYHMRSIGDLGHSIYAAKIGKLVVEGSRFYDGQSGHFIKSLAAVSRIYYNQIMDNNNINTHLVDLWACQDFEVVGNAMKRPGLYGNHMFVSVTERKAQQPDGTWLEEPCIQGRTLRGVVAYNTAVFTGGYDDDPRWAGLLHHNFYTITNPIEVANNLSVHTRSLIETLADGYDNVIADGGSVHNNVQTRLPMYDWFIDVPAGDLRLTAPRGTTGVVSGITVDRQIAYPVGTQARTTTANVGAFEFGAGTEASGDDEGEIPPPPVSPDVLEPGSYTLQPGVYELTVE